MNNFRVYFNETTILEIDGEKKTFVKGWHVAFKNVSDKDMKAIRKIAVKKNSLTFTLTDDTSHVYKVVYGNKGTARKDTIKDFIKMSKGSKKDKTTKFVKSEKQSEEKINTENDVDPLTCVKNNTIIEEEKTEVDQNEQV